jgi:fluoride exporter
MTLLAVALAGGLGAVARYCLDWAISFRSERAFPWGTFIINVTGSLGLGFLVGLAGFEDLPGVSRAAITTGFLGSYTTFSTWMYETVQLARDGAQRKALFNALGSVAAGAGAAGIGLVVGGTF